MSQLPHGAFALITSPGHRKDGQVGKILGGPGSFIGSYTVCVDGENYGLMPHELTVLTPSDENEPI